MFTGYVDDSGSEQSQLLTLSCLVGHASQTFWFEIEWNRCLEKKNKQLKTEGRQTISRYHAKDCSSRVREFKGWTVEEQIQFTTCLLGVFRLYPLAVASYTLNLQDLAFEFPEAKENPRPLGHILLLNHIVKFLAESLLNLPAYSTDRLALVHDRGAYNGVLAEAFGHLQQDATLQNRERLASITSIGWEECVMLQPADLVAYENFKAAERETAAFKRRKTLELLLDLKSFNGRGVLLRREAFAEIRSKLDDHAQRILFKNARIPQRPK